MSGECFLKLNNLKKDFSGVEVLKGISVEFRPGEIHALLGENGAGKSTLIKILTGVYHASSGEIVVAGKPVHMTGTNTASHLGIGAVYQDAELAWSLSVAENLMLGSEPGWLMNRKKLEETARATLEKIGLDIDPGRRADSLTAAEMQMLTLATLFHHNYKLIILDEPTARLSGKETKILFDLIKTFKSQGIAVIYISHRLQEVKLLCDWATILRDGKVVRTLDKDEIEEELITQLMVNRSKSDLEVQNPGYSSGQTALRLVDLATDKLAPLSLQLQKGEVLGITGPVGGGMEQIEKALCGLGHYSGRIDIDGADAHIVSPQQAIGLGVALVPEDRRKQALFPELSLAENVALPILKTIQKLGFVSSSATEKVGHSVIEALSVHPANPQSKMRYFSGGNQQKVVIGKWLNKKQKVYVFVEPTSGVDVGAIQQIYEIILQIVKDGGAVVLITTTLKEILALAENVLVIRDGEICARGPRSNFTRDSLLGHILGNGEAGASAQSVETS